MTIGTAKPSAEELALIPHHFINSHSITEEFSAGDFCREGRICLAELFKTHPYVLVAGGSGLYLRALLEGFDEMPVVPEDIRTTLNARLQNEGLQVLRKELADADPIYFSQVDPQNPQRVIRALEVITFTGEPFSRFRNAQTKDPVPYKLISVGLDLPRELLYKRINQRVDEMFLDGLEDEARRLYPYRSHYALQTVGYKELFACFDGEISLEESRKTIKQNTRRYAKRQLTWFRKYGDMTWFDPRNSDEIIDFITRIDSL